VAFEVLITPTAERAIRKLPARIQVAVLDRLEQLTDDPRPADCEKVTELGSYGVFRVKVAKDYRVLYQVRDKVMQVLVVKVANRNEVYQRLHELKQYLR
jgi:mRNA interferase RelE/StbE